MGEVGRGLWRRCGGGGANVGGDNTGGCGGRSEGARVCTHSATSVTEEVCVVPHTQRSISQGGDPADLELGASWVEVALARRHTMGRPYLDNTA